MFIYEIVKPAVGLHDVVEVFTGEGAKREVVFHAPDEGSAHAVAAALASYWANAFSGQWVPPRRTVYPVHGRRRTVKAA